MLPRPLAVGIDTLLDRTVAPGYTRIGPAIRRHLPTWPADPEPDAMKGKVVAVTGATSGLGLATAEGLARLGAEVVLVVRDTDKGARVLRDLGGRLPLAELHLARCDVGDLDDVRRFADELDVDHLDVLVHNAGAMPPERTESAQGHELTMALHVLGPVLMTELLRPRLTDARVVLVTSGGMYGQRLRVDDPEYLQGDYSPTTAYARSKRAQVELLPVLDQRWGGSGISVHATHPGWADTPGVVDSLPTFHKVTGPLLRDAAGGADTTVWLSATDPVPTGGQLWHDRRPRPFHLLRRTRTGEEERAALWQWVRRELDLPQDA
ncbi:SDR family NAD(P)-dependent oxidoreductase [Nocardioides sp. MAHUQ-72]|uniref:SDR family NAD(P)-dependent oxidoreductase n=1 Tax=unclassified Nocardioides TaxID=2615069 RepID=UPI00361F76B9